MYVIFCLLVKNGAIILLRFPKIVSLQSAEKCFFTKGFMLTCLLPQSRNKLWISFKGLPFNSMRFGFDH